MEKYETIKAVGDGSFGSVTKARNKLTNEIVAIKRMKATFATWEEAMKLREVKSLRKLNHHNVVKLKEVIRQKDSLYFVFEFMEKNLYEIISKNVVAPTEQEIKLMAFDSLQGIAACHKNGYFHRDLKPENLLINGAHVVKLADFGLAREIRARPPFTEYVSTRWYRAPELLLASTNYNSPIDIFAMGCILAEMYLLRPLAPGNSEADQLMKLCLVLGTPPIDWTEGYQLATQRRIDFPRCPVTPLQSIIPNASSEAIDLILKMLQWDPQKRPTAAACLQHPFFTQEIRAEYQRKVNASVQAVQIEEAVKKSPGGGAGFMQLRNSQNKGLQNKQMSQGVLSPLTNHSSMGAFSQEVQMTSYIPKIPNINNQPIDVKESGIFPANSKGSVIKRDSIAFKIDQNNQAFRSNKNSIHYAGPNNNNSISFSAASPNKQWDSTNNNTNQSQSQDAYGTSNQLYGLNKVSNPAFSSAETEYTLPKNQKNNRGIGQISNNNNSQAGSKIIISPKLVVGKTGIGLSSGMGGSSSILNLPILGQENIIMPTNRGMKGIESTKQLNRNEENKIQTTYEGSSLAMPPQNNPSFYNQRSNNSDPLSPSGNKEKAGQMAVQSTRNLSVLNMKKTSARFLSPIGAEGLANNNESHSLPPTNIAKYPTTSKPENSIVIMPPRGGIREAKNQQLFDKYMHKNMKASGEMPQNNQSGVSSMNTEQGPAGSDFALPSLGNPSSGSQQLNGGLRIPQSHLGGGAGAPPAISQLTGRNNVGQTNFQSRRKDQARASLSDSDFDF